MHSKNGWYVFTVNPKSLTKWDEENKTTDAYINNSGLSKASFQLTPH